MKARTAPIWIVPTFTAALVALTALGGPSPEPARARSNPGGRTRTKATRHRSPHKRLKRDCETCHVATSFKDIRFDHETTGFSIDGRHADLACLDCHSVEDFSRVENTCASCHEDIHRGRLGTSCERCHAPDGWRVIDAERIHAGSDFPLVGRHINADCEQCHRGARIGAFHDASPECVSCHRADYESATDPDHRASGFSTDCQGCHQPLRWRPATMVDHDGIFPIFSGTHNNQWGACAQCHVQPGNNKVVSCLTCHEHAQGLMDPVHQGINGYAYVTQECLNCHPTGVAGDFLEHDSAYFPIYRGAHKGKWGTCKKCHVNSADRGVFRCLDCHAHRQSKMDSKHRGRKGYSYDSNACYDCHPHGKG